MATKKILVRNLGRISYLQAMQIQSTIMNSLQCHPETTPSTLILLEHDPVYTHGHRQRLKSTMTPEDIEKLKVLGADYVVVSPCI